MTVCSTTDLLMQIVAIGFNKKILVRPERGIRADVLNSTPHKKFRPITQSRIFLLKPIDWIVPCREVFNPQQGPN